MCNDMFVGSSDGLVSPRAPGDIILIKAGVGVPAAKYDRVCVIAAVNSFSVLTADGIRLSAEDICELKGHTHSYPLTDKAIKFAKSCDIDLEEIEDLEEQELITGSPYAP